MGYRHRTTPPPTSVFATKASDFHLSSRRERDVKPRRRSNQFIETRSMDLDDDDEHIDARRLSRLRSNAFWELHRSVAENGEGLVRRMRDYEHSRSRTDIYLKAKEAQKRGRKRSSVVALSRRPKYLHIGSDNDQEDEDEGEGEDDDVQIFAGEVPRISLPGSAYPQKRSISLDVKGIDYQYTTDRRCSSPVTACITSPSIYHSDDEHLHSSSGTTSPNTSLHPLSPLVFNTSLPEEKLPDLDRTLLPALLPPLGNMSASRTEKAIAALSLAMASGAGGITDYDAPVALQAWPSLDEYQVGEMWH
ncbi:hypothetical protein H0H87_011059 [Tephrocybe sp. NHM501043]|nr:hypothetical protein H0H87_011059 [Tephrocybe sp. NHM501043]